MKIKQYLFLVSLGVSMFIISGMFNGASAQKKSGKGKSAAVSSSKIPLSDTEIDKKVAELLAKMSIEEKAGQMTQINLNVVLKGSYGNIDGSIDTALLRQAIVEY